MKNGSHRYNIEHGHRYTKYKMCLNIMMVMCNKQHLNNIWSWIHGKVSNTEGQLKKNVAGKKKRTYLKGGP